MNTTDEVEALPADVAALAAEADLGPHTLTCLPKRLGGIIGVILMLVAIPMTWVAVGKIMTAVARDTYGWELVLYAGPAAYLLFVCVQILNPRSRHVRFYGFARGFILRDGCLRLTHVSWAEIVRVRRLSVTRDSRTGTSFRRGAVGGARCTRRLIAVRTRSTRTWSAGHERAG
jgi:hypothetical protein